jgi:DNA-binding CsgD family transcriptional regulator
MSVRSWGRNSRAPSGISATAQPKIKSRLEIGGAPPDYPYPAQFLPTGNREGPPAFAGDQRFAMPSRSLSPIELKVLTLFAHGKSTEEIGEAVNLHKGAVQNHLRVAVRKLGATNRVHAAVIATNLGLIKTLKRA